jgi:hypothetical protein
MDVVFYRYLPVKSTVSMPVSAVMRETFCFLTNYVNWPCIMIS